MKWRKAGLIYAPSGERWWARSYAHLPTPYIVDSERIRVFFASLDKDRYGRIGYVDLDPENPTTVLDESTEPVLDIGETGTFDECGVNPSCVVDIGSEKYLYYIGWQRCERIPYMLFAGLAISRDGLKFERHSPVPVLDRTPDEPFLRSATTILKENGVLKTWYVSGLGWTTVHGAPYPSYVIRHAVSTDGIQWKTQGGICINFKNEDEFGFGRPWIIRDRDLFKMWYSIRSRSSPYRIGYAESSDGLNWTRRDDLVGIEKSASGWDSEMICYPSLLRVKNHTYMFYNGNQHGRTGFGFAVLEN